MRKKPIIQAGCLSLILATTLAAGCSADGGESTEHGQAAVQSATTEASAAKAEPAGRTTGGRKGDLAPDFTLTRLAGGDLTLSSLRGKTVIVDFWDTWCAPCRRALPDLQQLSDAYANDLVVVGVAFGQEGEAKVRSFVQQNKLTFEMVLLDQTGSLLKEFGGIQSIPTTFLIDADGVIREKWVGAADKHVYENAVVAAIAARGKAG